MTAPALKLTPQQRLDPTCPPWPDPPATPLRGKTIGYRLHNGEEAARVLVMDAMISAGGNMTRFRRLIERAEGTRIGRRTPYQWLEKFPPLRWARNQAQGTPPAPTAEDLLATACEKSLVITAREKRGGWEAELAADGKVLLWCMGADKGEAVAKLIASSAFFAPLCKSV